MTIDQLNKLTDEEVRERIANILFPDFPTYWERGSLRHRYSAESTGPAFNYPADLNAAFTLVEKLRGEGWDWCAATVRDDEMEARFWVGTKARHYASDRSLARAISLAFLAVTEREEG